MSRKLHGSILCKLGFLSISLPERGNRRIAISLTHRQIAFAMGLCMEDLSGDIGLGMQNQKVDPEPAEFRIGAQ